MLHATHLYLFILFWFALMYKSHKKHFAPRNGWPYLSTIKTNENDWSIRLTLLVVNVLHIWGLVHWHAQNFGSVIKRNFFTIRQLHIMWSKLPSLTNWTCTLICWIFDADRNHRVFLSTPCQRAGYLAWVSKMLFFRHWWTAAAAVKTNLKWNWMLKNKIANVRRIILKTTVAAE